MEIQGHQGVLPFLGIGLTYVSIAEILKAPGEESEKAQPAPFLVSKTSFAVLRVVKIPLLGFKFANLLLQH